MKRVIIPLMLKIVICWKSEQRETAPRLRAAKLRGVLESEFGEVEEQEGGWLVHSQGLDALLNSVGPGGGLVSVGSDSLRRAFQDRILIRLSSDGRELDCELKYWGWVTTFLYAYASAVAISGGWGEGLLSLAIKLVLFNGVPFGLSWLSFQLFFVARLAKRLD